MYQNEKILSTVKGPAHIVIQTKREISKMYLFVRSLAKRRFSEFNKKKCRFSEFSL